MVNMEVVMFEEFITEEEYSYILGFLHGDGTYSETTRDRGRIQVELSIKDIDILNKIELILSKTGIHIGRSERTRKIKFKHCDKIYDHTSCTLCITKKSMRTYFNLPVGKKSDIINPYKYDVIARDYIRGLTDADGSVGITKNNRPFWSLTTASDKMKEYLLESLYNIIGVDKILNRNKRDNIYNISQFDEGAVEYLNYLYKDSELYLDRKYQKYIETLSWTRTITKRTKLGKWQPHEEKILLLDELSIDEKIKILKRTRCSIINKLNKLNKVTKN